MRGFFNVLPLVPLMACGSYPAVPTNSNFSPPSAPNYADETYWAALPARVDQADLTPGDQLTNRRATAEANVFYVHPTITTLVITTCSGSTCG